MAEDNFPFRADNEINYLGITESFDIVQRNLRVLYVFLDSVD